MTDGIGSEWHRRNGLYSGRKQEPILTSVAEKESNMPIINHLS